MESSEDGTGRKKEERSAPESDKSQRTILFTCAENVSELREEHYDESFSSDALKTYLKHIGYCKGKKRKRCLSMELNRLLESKS